MGNNIDNRIVSLEFDNKQFETAMAQTIASLDRLTQALQLKDADLGFSKMEASANKVRLDGIASAVDSIASKFSALGAIGFTVIQNLTNSLLGMGKSMLAAITEPLIEGGRQRAANIGQAKFQFQGLGMDIDKTMASAKAAVLGTAYGLDQAAKAASVLGASGLRAGQEMTTTLRGIAGVAAMTNSSYEDIANIFENVAGQGRVMGDDLMMLGYRGINAAAILGKALGKSETDIREMVTKGEIGFQTFTKAMDGAFGQHAQDANKTYSGSLANVRAALARVTEPYFTYDMEGKRRIFNALIPVIDGVAKALKPVIDIMGKQSIGTSDWVVKLIKSIDMTTVGRSIPHAFNAIQNVVAAVKAAISPLPAMFRAIFPASTNVNLYGLIRGFETFTRTLIPGVTMLRHIGVAFKGVFAIFSLAGKSIKFVVDAIRTIVDVLTDSGKATDGFSKNFGKNLDAFFKFFIALNESGDVARTFADALDSIRNTMITIKPVTDVVASGFAAIGRGIETAFTWVGHLLTKLKPAANGMTVMGKVALFMSDVFAAVTRVINATISVLSPLAKKFAELIHKTSLSDWLKTILALFTANTLLSITGVMNKIWLSINGLGLNIKNTIGSLKFALMGLQSELNAKTLKQIAAAVLLLAAAMWVISKIQPDRLKASMGAMTVLLGGLLGVLAGFSKISGGGSLDGIFKAQTSLILLSIALLLMAGAVQKLGKLDPDTITKGLLAIGALLTELGLFSKIFTTQRGMVSAGAGMMLFSVALLILTKSVEALGKMKGDKLLQGMLALALLFAAVGEFSNVVDPVKIAVAGFSMIGFAVGIAILAGALKVFGSMSLAQIGTGLLAMAGGLVIIVAALNLMPKDMALKAVGLLIVSVAITILAGALKLLGGLSMEQLATSLLALGTALLIISLVLIALSEPNILIGAAALAIVSAALVVLAGALKALGGMSPGQVATALITMALAFIIIGAAGLLLTEAIPGMLALGLAFLLIGLGVTAAGAGMFLFATGIGLLATAVATGGAVIIAFIVGMAQALPTIAVALAQAVGAFFKELANQSTSLLAGITTLISTFLQALTAALPLLLNLMNMIIVGLVQLLVNNVPIIVNAFLFLLNAILVAIGAWLPSIMTAAVTIIVNFINGLSSAQDRIVTAGANFIIKLIQGLAREALRITNEAAKTIITFINGLTTAINNNGAKFDAAMNNLISALFTRAEKLIGGVFNFAKIGNNIVAGVASGIEAWVDKVTAPIRKMIQEAYDAAKSHGIIKSPSKLFARIGVWLVQGMIVGIENTTNAAAKSAGSVVTTMYSAMQMAADQANDVFNDLAQPTITPVINLDSVHEGVRAISSLMNSASAVAVSNEVSGRMGQNGSSSAPTSTDGDSKKTEINLTQNNYSPKYLSRLEIYRQTKNLIRARELGIG